MGLGDLVLDHIFRGEGIGERRYRGSRGGGTFGNVLANAACAGVGTVAVGTAGGDRWGEATRAELASYDVDVRNLVLVPRKRTRVIFQLITATHEMSLGDVSHVFTMRCPVCKKSQDSRAIARAGSRELLPAMDLNPKSVLVDTLGQDRVRVAAQLRDRGALTLLDLGRPAYLRRQPITVVAEGLQAFDILFVPRNVAEELRRRLGMDDPMQLARDLNLVVIASDGDQGLWIYDARKRRGQQVKPPAGLRVIDSSGAGDALLARVFYELSASTRRRSAAHLVGTVSRALDAVPPVLQVIGARGHLPRSEAFPEPFPTWIGKTGAQIWAEVKGEERCPFCDSLLSEPASVFRPRKTKPGAKANLALLSKRVFFASERERAVAQCRELLDANGTVFVVGSGGSFPVAAFVAETLNRHGQLFAQAIRPFDYIRAARPTTFVIAISYSGSTADIAEVLEFAKQIDRNTRLVLLTGAANPPLARKLRGKTDLVISYAGRVSRGPRRMEGGFVSIAGTVSPCALWAAAVEGPRAMARFAARVSRPSFEWLSAVESTVQAAALGEGLVVIGGGYAWPAMLDLESKFTEANLGPVLIHESKDFSHGRFMTTLAQKPRQRSALVLSVGPLHPYERALVDALGTSLEVQVLESEHLEQLGALELLLRVQQLVYMTGDRRQMDISRPKYIPPDGLTLYRWKDGLTRE